MENNIGIKMLSEETLKLYDYHKRQKHIDNIIRNFILPGRTCTIKIKTSNNNKL